MRSNRLALVLISAILACTVAHGAEPAPTTSESGSSAGKSAAVKTAEVASGKTNTPFWTAPKLNLNLSPIAVTLDSVPTGSVPLGLLQLGNVDPRTFVVTNPAAVPFVTGADTGYEVVAGGLTPGALLYGDRKYVIRKLPDALAGLSLLRTRNADKAIMDGRFAVVVVSPKPCYVLVALDERAIDTYKQYGTPGWLQEFAPTDYKIESDDPLMADAHASFQVFARKAPAGRIALGPPCMDIVHNAMYFAFFAEAK